jgi:hypothetical protein
MAAFVDFAQQLLTQGAVVLRERPRQTPPDRAEAGALLRRAHADCRLDVAGPLLPFDADAALSAAERVWWACWFLVQRGEPPEELDRCLAPLPAPTAAAQHLSADLTLRFLPQVHRRARALAADDPLTRRLEDILRRWPLSGVLADVGEAPLTPVEFAGHPGLLLLYAERLAGNVRPSWVPGGPALEYVELIFAERDLPVPAALPALQQESAS